MRHGKDYKRIWPARRKSLGPIRGPGRERVRALEERLADAERQVREKEALARALERIGRALDQKRPGPEALFEIAEIARAVTDTDAAQILLLEPGTKTLTLAADTNEPEKVRRVSIKLGQGLTGWAAEHRRPVAIRREPWNDPRFLDYPGLDERSFQSLLCVPLISNGELLGVVNVRTRRPYGYTDSEANVLSQIAEQVARAIRHQSQVASLKTEAARYAAVSEVGGLIAGSPYLEEILQLLVSFTAERLNYKVVTVRLLDEARQELVIRATQSKNLAYRRKRSIRVGESFAGRAVVEKRILTTADVTKSPEYIGADLAVEQGLRSMASVPLLIRDKAIGVMTCYTDRVGEFSRVELKALEALAKQAAVAIEHAKLQVRTTLMQEMHHRVKNNLQQIVSLLRLQQAEARHETLEEALNDSLNRILAIARVHDLLSREDLDRVGIRSVAETLVQHQQQALLPPGKQIAFSVEGDDVPLGMTQATQVALILNELLQNAVEHGFRTTEEGQVHVCIAVKGDEVCLWVSNSGERIPADFDMQLDSHLGLKIVRRLAEAIGGHFSLRTAYNWVVAEIRFPLEQAEEG
ncbi:MAG: GAF domain-containing protein [Armatimonadetes bacterium]|nr:GAF domain-containing protein [Armatimonadota bacterium]